MAVVGTIDALTARLAGLFAIAGGGGSGGGGGGGGGGGSFSGGGSGGSGSWIDFVGTLVLMTIVFIVFFIISRKAAKKLRERRARIKLALEAAAAEDKVWEPDTLVTHAKDIFKRYQKDWSAFDLESMKTYMTPEYYQHNLLMMGAMKLMNRQNDVQLPVVYVSEVEDMRDAADNDKDTYMVRLSVQVFDVLNDTATNKRLFAQNLATTEYYKFVRKGDSWLFAGIDQATANPALRNASLETFAAHHKYFYSIDWGHLLLPRRGQLFKGGSFGVSDINNHVIGLYKDIIIQLYTYIPQPQRATTSYLIAQTAVPKNYGNIVVRRRKGWFAGGIIGLKRIKLEWQDFNLKYDVFATSTEQATSFELLNPKFMEQLQALPFEVNIEVVDNIVYLYAPEQAGVNDQHYATILEVLKAAFKEMRL